MEDDNGQPKPIDIESQIAEIKNTCLREVLARLDEQLGATPPEPHSSRFQKDNRATLLAFRERVANAQNPGPETESRTADVILRELQDRTGINAENCHVAIGMLGENSTGGDAGDKNIEISTIEPFAAAFSDAFRLLSGAADQVKNLISPAEPAATQLPASAASPAVTVEWPAWTGAQSAPRDKVAIFEQTILYTALRKMLDRIDRFPKRNSARAGAPEILQAFRPVLAQIREEIFLTQSFAVNDQKVVDIFTDLIDRCEGELINLEEVEAITEKTNNSAIKLVLDDLISIAHHAIRDLIPVEFKLPQQTIELSRTIPIVESRLVSPGSHRIPSEDSEIPAFLLRQQKPDPEIYTPQADQPPLRSGIIRSKSDEARSTRRRLWSAVAAVVLGIAAYATPDLYQSAMSITIWAKNEIFPRMATISNAAGPYLKLNNAMLERQVDELASRWGPRPSSIPMPGMGDRALN